MKRILQYIKDIWDTEHYITFHYESIAEAQRNILYKLYLKYHKDPHEYIDAVTKKIVRDKEIIFFCHDIAKHEIFRMFRTGDGVHVVQMIFDNKDTKSLNRTIKFLEKNKIRKRTWLVKMLLIGRIRAYEFKEEIEGISSKLIIYYGWHRKDIADDVMKLVKVAYKKSLTSKLYGVYIDQILEDFEDQLS